MGRPIAAPTGRERTFKDHEIIVSKTDPKGVITYANDVFVRVSGFTEEELLGAPHNIIRHPDMPRCVFKLLWDTIQAGQEIFAYVVNLCKSGDHYWVLAHVTPSFDDDGRIIGYHSSRRTPDREAVEKVKPLYAALKQTEDAAADWREGMRKATGLLLAQLDEAGVEYGEFVFSL
jgi:PAS domain S-box-containing protein